MLSFLDGVDRQQIIKVVAIWFIIGGILSLCGGLALLGLGGFAGILGAGTAATLSESGAGTDEAVAAGAGLAAAGGLAVILGIISIVTGPAMIIVSVGLFQKRSWARMGTVVLAGIGAVLALLSIITGGGLGGNIVPLIIDGFVAYLFYTDPGIKQALPG